MNTGGNYVPESPRISWCHGFLEGGEIALHNMGRGKCLTQKWRETKEKNKEGGETGPSVWKKAKKKELPWYTVVKRTLLARNVKYRF